MDARFGHGCALFNLHALTEDGDQRQAHERDDDTRLVTFGFPVVYRPVATMS